MQTSPHTITVERQTPAGLRRVVVTREGRGWLLREEAEQQLLRQVTYDDWHRVERAIRRFEAHSTNL